MITHTSLVHPSMQIKIKSCRVQAMMGLVAKLRNRKGDVIMVCVKHGNFEDFQESTFYAVYEDGSVGHDVTDMVLKACPYPVATVKKSFFQKAISIVKSKAQDVYDNMSVKAGAYVHGIALVGFAFS